MSSVGGVSSSDYWYTQYLQQMQSSSSSTSLLNDLSGSTSTDGSQDSTNDFAGILSALQTETSQLTSSMLSTPATTEIDPSNSSQLSQNDDLQSLDQMMALLSAGN
jgi:hypothetical protein